MLSFRHRVAQLICLLLGVLVGCEGQSAGMTKPPAADAAVTPEPGESMVAHVLLVPVQGPSAPKSGDAGVSPPLLPVGGGSGFFNPGPPRCGDGIVQVELGEECERNERLYYCSALGTGRTGYAACTDCQIDTSVCAGQQPDGPGTIGTPDDDAGLMTCRPGGPCQLSGRGVCTANGRLCALCTSDAQCLKVYGPPFGVCASGACAQCDDGHPCSAGQSCFEGRCSTPS